MTMCLAYKNSGTGKAAVFMNRMYEQEQAKKKPPAPKPAPAPIVPDATADGPIVGDSDPAMEGGRQERRRRQTGIFSNILTSTSGDLLFGGNTLQRATFGGR